MKKHYLRFLIAAILATALLAACGTDGGAADTGAADAGVAAGNGSAAPAAEIGDLGGAGYSRHQAGHVNLFGWTVPEEPIYLTILFAGGNHSEWESETVGRQNHVAHFMEEFNLHITPVHVAGDGPEYINLALASGNYPYDIIADLNRTQTAIFVEQNRAVELTPYLDNIGSDLRDRIQHLMPMLTDNEGRLWSVPYFFGTQYEMPDRTAHIRYDEWGALGFPVFNTPEEYMEVLYRILEEFPLTPDGETRFAMSLPGFQDNVIGLTETFAGFWGHQLGYMITDNGATWTHWSRTDEGRAMSRWMNQFHRDGTLDPDAFVHDFAEWREIFSRERIVGAIGGWWIGMHAGHEIWMSLDPNSPEEKRFLQVSFMADGAPGAFLSPKNEIGSTNTIITDFASNPDDAMRFLNFCATFSGIRLGGWGLPNGTPIGNTGRSWQAWNLFDDGTWEFYEPARQQLVTETWNFNEAGFFSAMPSVFIYVNRWPDGVHCFWPNQMWYEDNFWRGRMLPEIEGTMFDATAMQIVEFTDEIMLLDTAIVDAIRIHWPIVVTANNDAEFDQAWAALQNALEMAGIGRFEEIRAETYLRNTGR